MKIVLDARIAQGYREGLAVYVKNLVAAIVEKSGNHELSLLTSDAEPALGFAARAQAEELPVAPSLQNRAARDVWEQLILPDILRKLRADVYHGPAYTIPCLRPLPCASVLTIFDASIFALPDCYSRLGQMRLAWLIRRSARSATRIICGSEHARTDAIRYIGGYVSEKTTSILSALPREIERPGKPTVEEIQAVKARYASGQRYFFTVGTLNPRKNFERLIEAFSTLPDRTTVLLICGRHGWKTDTILSAPVRFGVAERVRFLGSLPDNEMRSLMSGAEAFIFPSLYEGFGLPLLESFALGTPVAASSVSSIPEVVGSAALLFNPLVVTEIAKAMSQFTTDLDLAKKLVQRGYERLGLFSWERCATEHLSVYESAQSAWLTEHER